MSITNERFYTENKNGVISIYAQEKSNYKLYFSHTAAGFDKADYICDFTDTASFAAMLGQRKYFHIISGDKRFVTAQRCIEVPGMDNLRDLGGYLTCDGKQVKWGVFLRSGALGFAAGEQAKKQLEELNIKTVLDLRSGTEIKELPDIALNGASYTAKSALISMDNSEVNFDLSRICAEGTKALDEAGKFVSDGYLLMPFDNPAYKFMFNTLLNEEVPILFHCTAGKDRTGIAAALILTALGVPFDTVCEDYMLTNILREKTAEKMRGKYGALISASNPGLDTAHIFKLIAGVQAENLKAAFNAIYSKYADFDEYLAVEYGIGKTEKEKLKQLYLV